MKGYEAGQTTSFTPSRQAEWIHEFNRFLEQSDVKSRNKVTEILLEKGIEAWKGKSLTADLPDKESLPSLESSVTLKCDKLSLEQKELLQTSHFQNLLECFVLRLFGEMDLTEQKLMSEFNDVTFESESIEIKSETAASTVVFNESVESDAPEIKETSLKEEEPINRALPIKETQPRRKANMTNALNFVKSTQINDND